MTQRRRRWRGPERSASFLGPASGRSRANGKFKAAASRKRRRRGSMATRLASHRSARRSLPACTVKPVPVDAYASAAAPIATRLDCVMPAAGRAQSLEMGDSRRQRSAEAPAGQDAGPRLPARPRRAHERAKSSTKLIINEGAGAKLKKSAHLQMQTTTNIRRLKRVASRQIAATSQCDEQLDEISTRSTTRGKVRSSRTRRTRHEIESRGVIRKTRTCSIRCPASFISSSRSQPTEENSGSAAVPAPGTRTATRRSQLARAANTYAQSMLSGQALAGGSSAGARPPLGSEIQVIIDRLRQKTERVKDLVEASNKRSGAGVRLSPFRRAGPLNEMELIKSRSRVHQWQWSQVNKSHECIVSRDRLSLCFHPHCSESTALCRASEPLRRDGNYYYWEIHVQDKTYGTSVMFGLCTKKQRMHANEYCNLVGLDENGWSVSHKGLAWHQGKSRQFTDMFPENRPVTIGLLYNSMRGELSYFLNGKSLGVAFSGLNQVDADLYPVAGSTAKCTQMRLLGAYCGNMTLLERASFTLLQNSRDPSELLEYLRNFHLPTSLLEQLTRVANVPQIPDNSADGQTNGPGCGDAKQERRNFEDNDQLMMNG